MAEVRCRYCGEAFTVELAPGQNADLLPPGLRVCGGCSEKALDEGDADGTMMLSPEAANVLGQPQTASKPASNRVSQASGRSFGGYEIIEEISRGSFGVVYRARQKGLDRVVALKVLLAGAHASSDMVARFQREARAAARVKHAWIGPMCDIGSEDEHHYFAMEFIEGESLSARIARGNLSIPETLAIVEDLADAMEMAHSQGVVHRDLKPSNIILNADGQPNITDFGLAKQVDLDTRYTQSGTTLGTPAYMPPEQARGEIDTVDARSDVYALGAILYEMLTGAPPFGGRSLLEVVVAVLNEPVRPPRQVNPKIHRDVQTIVLKCLEKQPSQRYDSAGELRDDIRRFRSGEAIRARPIGPFRLAGRFAHRHAFFFLAVATVLLAVGLSIWYASDVQRQLVEAKERARQEQEARERIEQQKTLKSTRAEWKPFWWTPEKPEDNLAPDEREFFRRGFVHPISPVPDWAAGRDIVLLPDKVLVSPEEKRIFGDSEARLRFRLSAQAAAQGVRVGIQSHEGGLPFVLSVRPGRLTLVGPTNLYRTYLAGNQARAPLMVKAEKTGPSLVAGEYQMTVRRDGLMLSFHLQPPEGLPPVRLVAWDMELSHWKFKNTQVTIREAPDGFELLEAMVLRKSSPERLDDLSQALSFFNNGEYNGAEAELDAIVGKRAVEEKDLVKVAQANFYLGLIQEICQPQMGAEARYYARVLDTLSQCQNAREARTLEGRVRLRRLILFAAQGRWARAEDERVRIAALAPDLPVFPSPVPGVGEPFAWELVPVLSAALRRGEEDAREFAFSLFKMIGLPPGSDQLGRAASELGRHLASTQRFDDLLALQRAYPSPALLPAFRQAMEWALKAGERKRAFELLDFVLHGLPGQETALEGVATNLVGSCLKENDLEMASATFDLFPRPVLAVALQQALEQMKTPPTGRKLKEYLNLLRRVGALNLKAEERKAMTTCVIHLAEGLVAGSHWQELRELHTAWPVPELGPALAQSILALAAISTVEAENEALGLLRYAHAQNLRDAPELQAAAVRFARQSVEARGEEAYALILSVHRAFPTAKLIDLTADALRGLIKRGAQGSALSFFGSARVEFGREAEPLFPQIVDLLRSLPQDQASQALADLRVVVRQPLRAQLREEHLWQLECGDLYLAIGRTEKAAEMWSELAAADGLDPETVCRVTLRLCAWNLAQGQPLPLEIWAPATVADDFPEESRLMARFVTGALLSQELDANLQRLAGTRIFCDAEWDLARALRARAEGREVDTMQLLWSAASKAGPTRAWPYYLLEMTRNRTP